MGREQDELVGMDGVVAALRICPADLQLQGA